MTEDQWVIRYAQGPAAQVGPFPSKEAAEAWAQRYAAEVTVAAPPRAPGMPLEWHIGLLVSPSSLEWWTA